jgi:hypothetical protein
MATLELDGVVAETPTGQEVPLGDITVVNTGWQWWHPFECHLVDAGAAAVVPTASVYKFRCDSVEVARVVEQVEADVVAVDDERVHGGVFCSPVIRRRRAGRP